MLHIWTVLLINPVALGMSVCCLHYCRGHSLHSAIVFNFYRHTTGMFMYGIL